jgi:hypothetical protein
MTERNLYDDFDYPLLEPPFEMKAFEEMTRAEARQHFEWFVAQSEPRRKLLVQAMKATDGPYRALDYTPESLVALWDWATRFLAADQPTEEEYEAFLESSPAWVRQAGTKPAELTVGTMCLCLDIGYYLAEVFMSESEGLQWALWTKKTGPFNKPYLDGFRLPLVPSDLASSCAWSVINTGERDPSLLFNAYAVWQEDLE